MDSVLSQTCLPRELIVVDDCSIGRIDQIVESRGISGVDIRFHRLERHQGAPNARNVGASLAQGDILMFLDDDDFWEPSKVETQLSALEAHPEAGTVYTGTIAINDTDAGRVLSLSRDHLSGQAWPHILFRNFIGSTSAAAIRRCLFHHVGGFDPELRALQDYDLWLRLSMAAPVVYDGTHNLKFSAVSKCSTRIGDIIPNYEIAFDILAKKYKREISALSFWQQRQYRAQTLLLLAGKHFEQSHYERCSMCLLEAAFLYPQTISRVMRSALRRWIPVKMV